MIWINELKSRFNNTTIIQNDKKFIQDRCPIHLQSMPEPSVIIDVDKLIKREVMIDRIINGKPICDVLAFCKSDDHQVAILIEAKTSKHHSSERIREAINQLSWSMQHLDLAVQMCSILPLNCARYPVVTFTKINDAVLRIPTVKRAFQEFRRYHGRRIFYVRAGQDIWQNIQNRQT